MCIRDQVTLLLNKHCKREEYLRSVYSKSVHPRIIGHQSLIIGRWGLTTGSAGTGLRSGSPDLFCKYPHTYKPT